jgi:hypothetical protein
MTEASHALRRSLARARAGKALSVDEAEALLGARGDALGELLQIAAGLRDLGHGRTITYSRKVFIPLTMLCRDHCHYCTFAKPPAKLESVFLTPEQVVAIADAGRRQQCKEALFTLGDRPEERYPEAREWLAARGYASTLEYVRAAAIRVIEETGLLPHLNPGVMSWEDMARLKHVSASMGLMLETSSDRLSEKGGPHVLERRGVPPCCQPFACFRIPVLGPITEREQRLLALLPTSRVGDGHDLFGGEERRLQLGRRLCEGAVVAVIPAQHGQRNEDLAGVRDRAAVAEIAQTGGDLQQLAERVTPGTEQRLGFVDGEGFTRAGPRQRPAEGVRGFGHRPPESTADWALRQTG